MSSTTQARQQILARIHSATEPDGDQAQSYAALPRPYVRKGKLAKEACLDLLVERLREYDAEVVEATPEELPDAIASQLAGSGRHIFVAPAGLPSAWLIKGFDWRVDNGLPNAEIELAEGVVTGAFCAVADSGTIVLHHSATEGRRVLTLLPDWHLCILRASQVVETLPEYFDRCEQPATSHPSDEDLSPGTPVLATYVSGPSATADIEMTRIKGVHGPRFLHVILVRDES
jgi:L-lactate dehydrogenase complex protein LldG